MHCVICGKSTDGEVEQAKVRSNVRKFASETFTVWRCAHCLSLHARDSVDLVHYYADYPFHHLNETKADWMLQAMYRNLLSRLKQAGLDKEMRILDFGCGSGLFLGFLKEQGYGNAFGYDEYSKHYTDKRVLCEQYDCVMTQDVIEHVPDPLVFAKEMHTLARPGGIVAIGTPNAEAIDLRDPEPRIHALHQPYHRHILSKRALVSLGKDLGWQLLRYYPTMYANTRVPGANSAFLSHYLRSFDNQADLLIEPIKLSNPKLWTPVTLLHLLFGSFWAPESDVMAIFMKAV